MTRTALAIAALLLPSTALAWPFEVLPEASIGQEVTGLATVARADGTALLALGQQSSWVIEPASGEVVRAISQGGMAAVAMDLDGDSTRELVFCAADGLWGMRWEGADYSLLSVPLAEEPCSAVQVLVGPESTLVAAAGPDGVTRLYEPTSTGLAEVSRVDLPAIDEDSAQLASGTPGAPLLATRRGYLGIGAIGRAQLVEHGPMGNSTLATGGPIGGLAFGPRGWAWTLPERDMVADVTHRVVPVAPRPGPLAMAQLDDDGEPDLVVLHPSEGLMGVIPATTRGEATHPIPEGVDQISGGDVDGDGCGDVVLGSSTYGTVQVWRSTACMGVPLHIRPEGDALVRNELRGRAPLGTAVDREPVVEVRPEPEQAPGDDWESVNDTAPAPVHAQTLPPLPPAPEVFGVETPAFLGDRPLIDHERLKKQQYIVLGTGWAIGGTLEPTWLQIPFFPALSVEFESGGPKARWFVGGDSAGLFFWVTESGGGIHLANLSMGATFGSPRLRAGPFVTGGLYNVGAGVRTVLTPWQESRTEFRGIEARLTWFAPSTGQVSLMYVWSEPLKRITDADRSRLKERARRLVDEPDAYKPRGPFACARFNAMAGVALGASSTRLSWEFVGESAAYSLTGSPVVSLSCDTGEKGGFLFSAETAPFFRFITNKDDRLFHMGSHTLGPMIGGPGFRIGPVGMVGVWTAGAGLRTAFDVHTDRQGLKHRVEVRAMGLYPSAPSGQLMMMYGFSYDPRK